MKTFLQQRIDLFFVVTIFIIANISPIILKYGFTDDYSFLYTYSVGNFLELRNLFISIGRPINGLLVELVFSNLYFISDLRIIRSLSLLGFIILIGILYEIIKKTHLSKAERISLLIFLSSVPSISLYISWAQYFTIPISLIFSVLSALVINKFKFKIKLNYLSNFVLLFSGILLLLLASFIHQSASMYYWVIFSIILFFQDKIKQKSTALIELFAKYLFVWISAMGFSYLWIVLAKNIISMPAITRTKLVNDYLGKLIWFLDEVVIRSLNFNLMKDSKLIAIFFILIIAIGFFIFFKKNNLNKFLGYLIITFLLLLSYFPNLVISENWASYRTQIAISSLFVIFIFLGFRNIAYSFFFEKYQLVYKIFLLILPLISMGLYSYHQIIDMTFSQSIEIGFLKYLLSPLNYQEYKEIIIVRSSWEDSLSQAIFDEFGMPSSYTGWAPEPMIRLLLREIDIGLKDIKISVLPPRSYVDQNSQVLVIYMEDYKYFRLIE
jgi:hypothetical protein